MSALLPSFERLLDAYPGAEMAALDQAGYLDALRDLPLIEVEPLIRALGRRGLAEPIAETMAERAVEQPTRELLAVLAAVEIAGGAERLLRMSVAHAGQREQFGKPIGAFQAIQQQIAVLAEKAVLVRIAAQAGCTHGLRPSTELAAVAKSIAGAAVPVMTGIAHAVHGAIGITADFPLHRITARMHALRMAHGAESYWNARLGQARLAFSAGNSLDFVRAI
jgi:acyl-CoA dehydrogenase